MALARTQVTQIVPLFKGVKTLDLSVLASFEDDEIRTFAKLRGVDTLKLRGAALEKGNILRSFPGLTGLHFHSMHDCDLSDSSSLTGLKELSWAWGGRVHGPGLAALGSCSKLQVRLPCRCWERVRLLFHAAWVPETIAHGVFARGIVASCRDYALNAYTIKKGRKGHSH